MNVIETLELAPEARMVAVDRAVAELRRGSAVVIESRGSAVLAQAAETATAASLARLQGWPEGGARLALTAERAGVLALTERATGVVSLPLTGSMDMVTLRRLTDPLFPGPAVLVGPIGIRPEAADSGAAAAVGLAKLAQLLPAALTVPAAANSWLRVRGAAPDLLVVDAAAISAYADDAARTLRPVADARVPLEVAENARVVGFRPADGGIEQFAIVIGEPASHQPALCRLHSECFTGDLLGSLRCDCGPQLQRALATIGAAGHGVLLYLAHEGRGIGLINKLRAYQLQDRGLDTLDANQHLGFAPDERSFQAAAVMLGHLGIARVRLLTNNPAKVSALERAGIEVVERLPHATSPNRHNRHYLATKARRAGHLLDDREPT